VDQIGLNLSLQLLEGAVHERQGVLIADEVEVSHFGAATVNRLHALHGRLQFDKIVVPHDLENRHFGAIQQLRQEPGLVPLRLFWSIESIGATQQIARKHDRIDVICGTFNSQP